MIGIEYFLEDRRHEEFITSLVRRIAAEEGVQTTHRVLAASGGSRVLPQYKDYMRVRKKTGLPDADLLIIAIDGNCKGHMDKERELSPIVPNGLREHIIYCIPDPHIERWYLLDLHALKTAVGMDLTIPQPAYVCQKRQKDYYKSILGNALRPIGSLLGGPEFAEQIVQHLDLHLLSRADGGFDRFVQELRTKLRVL
jgi:hypothetical protein